MADRAREPWSVRREQVADLRSRHERSGRPVRELAREAGLPVAAIYGWLKRPRREALRGAAVDHRKRPVNPASTALACIRHAKRALTAARS